MMTVRALLWQFYIVATILPQCTTAASFPDRHHINRKIQTSLIYLKMILNSMVLIFHILNHFFILLLKTLLLKNVQQRPIGFVRL
jgi:hypothetical protein